MSGTDILVVGSGMAGLTAALAARARGRSVSLVTLGAGAAGIGSGVVDALGRVGGADVSGHPLDAIGGLSESHPYRLIGREDVAAALDFVRERAAAGGCPLDARPDGGNRWLPTILGTLKPSWLCPPQMRGELLETARHAVIVGVDGLRDCRPQAIQAGLRRRKALADVELGTAMLENPRPGAHRDLTPLDIARLVEEPEGERWLVSGLKRVAAAHPGADLLLLPPVCGLGLRAWWDLCAQVPLPMLEMIAMPPGTGGFRLHAALRAALRADGVDIVENARIVGADVRDGACTALKAETTCGGRLFRASSFILATGGFLGGGLAAEAGRARETVFGLPVVTADGAPLPEDPAGWAEEDIFGGHAFASAGVRVNADMLPADADGAPLLRNVRFAGRSVRGHDFALEKSGCGVAAATAWRAARSACKETA